jgi:hypothetical protein
VLAIPESYLIEKDGSNYVKLLTWQDAERKQYQIAEVEVTLGLTTDVYVEIKAGLQEGQEIVEPTFTEARNFSLFANN